MKREKTIKLANQRIWCICFRGGDSKLNAKLYEGERRKYLQNNRGQGEKVIGCHLVGSTREELRNVFEKYRYAICTFLLQGFPSNQNSAKFRGQLLFHIRRNENIFLPTRLIPQDQIEFSALENKKYAKQRKSHNPPKDKIKSQFQLLVNNRFFIQQ